MTDLRNNWDTVRVMFSMELHLCVMSKSPFSMDQNTGLRGWRVNIFTSHMTGKCMLL